MSSYHPDALVEKVKEALGESPPPFYRQYPADTFYHYWHGNVLALVEPIMQLYRRGGHWNIRLANTYIARTSPGVITRNLTISYRQEVNSQLPLHEVVKKLQEKGVNIRYWLIKPQYCRYRYGNIVAYCTDLVAYRVSDPVKGAMVCERAREEPERLHQGANHVACLARYESHGKENYATTGMLRFMLASLGESTTPFARVTKGGSWTTYVPKWFVQMSRFVTTEKLNQLWRRLAGGVREIPRELHEDYLKPLSYLDLRYMIEKHVLAMNYANKYFEDPRVEEGLRVARVVLSFLQSPGSEQGSSHHGESKVPVVRPVESSNVE